MSIAVAADATPGNRTLVITTPAGTSDDAPAPGNRLRVTDRVLADYRALATPVPGVQVGAAGPDDGDLEELDERSTALGLTVGAAALDLYPDHGTIGAEVGLEITGTGLTGVVGLSVQPPTGIVLHSVSPDPDGALAPTVDTILALPEDGVFQFTTIEIPAGVTVGFERNTANTPVILLASGDVTIAGTISISGTDSPAVGTAGDGALADDSLPRGRRPRRL